MSNTANKPLFTPITLEQAKKLPFSSLAKRIVYQDPQSIKVFKEIVKKSEAEDNSYVHFLRAELEHQINAAAALEYAKFNITFEDLSSVKGIDFKTFYSLFCANTFSSLHPAQVTPAWQEHYCDLVLQLLSKKGLSKIVMGLRPGFHFSSKDLQEDPRVKALSQIPSRCVVGVVLIDFIKKNNLNFNATPKELQAALEKSKHTISSKNHHLASLIISFLYNNNYYFRDPALLKRAPIKDIRKSLHILEHDFFMLEYILKQCNLKEKDFWQSAKEIFSKELIDLFETNEYKIAIDGKRGLESLVPKATSTTTHSKEKSLTNKI